MYVKTLKDKSCWFENKKPSRSLFVCLIVLKSLVQHTGVDLEIPGESYLVCCKLSRSRTTDVYVCVCRCLCLGGWNACVSSYSNWNRQTVIRVVSPRTSQFVCLFVCISLFKLWSPPNHWTELQLKRNLESGQQMKNTTRLLLLLLLFFGGEAGVIAVGESKKRRNIQERNTMKKSEKYVSMMTWGCCLMIALRRLSMHKEESLRLRAIHIHGQGVTKRGKTNLQRQHLSTNCRIMLVQVRGKRKGLMSFPYFFSNFKFRACVASCKEYI